MEEAPLVRDSSARKRPGNAGKSVALLAIGCAMGAIAMLAISRMSEAQQRPSLARNVLRQSSPDKVLTTPEVPVEEAKPQQSSPPEQSVEKPAQSPAAPQSSPSVPPKVPGGPTGTAPYNPFSGAISAMPPAEISGSLPAGAVNPGGVVGGTVSRPGSVPAAEKSPAVSPQIEDAPKGLLVSVSLDAGDPNAAVATLRGIASRFGGTAVQFDESASRLDAEGALVFVPAAKAAELEKSLTQAGSVVSAERWTGGTGARVSRIESAAEARLGDLETRRDELLVKYFEDAPQIKNLDEDAERIKKSLASFRSRRPGANTAVFKIRFLR